MQTLLHMNWLKQSIAHALHALASIAMEAETPSRCWRKGVLQERVQDKDVPVRALLVRKQWLDQIVAGEKTIELRSRQHNFANTYIYLMETISGKMRAKARLHRARRLTIEESIEHQDVIEYLNYKTTWAWPLDEIEALQGEEAIIVPGDCRRRLVTWVPRDRWQHGPIADMRSAPSGSQDAEPQEKRPRVDRGATPTREPELTEWSIDELHLFEAEAAELMTNAEAAELEVASMKSLVDRIPEDLRRAHGLPISTDDYAVALENAKRTQDRILEFVKNVKMAHMKLASKLLDKASAKFHVTEEFAKGGLLLRLAESSDYLLDRDPIDAAIALFKEAEGEAKAAAGEDLAALEIEVIREQVADLGTAQALWEHAQQFAHSHHRLEPTREQTKTFLSRVDTQLRKALAIAPESQYDLKIKPKTWKQDVENAFNLAYYTYQAWLTE